MKLATILETIEGIPAYPGIDLEIEVNRGIAADLMSDVLRFGTEETLLVTGLVNLQAIRTVEMVGIPALVFVRAKIAPPETIALARQKRIPLLATRYTMYETCGLLYKAGLPGIGPCGEFG